MVSKKSLKKLTPYLSINVVHEKVTQATLLSSRETSGRHVLTGVLSLVQEALRTRARQF